MRIACTGFISERSGSVAAANALLLCSLLDRGIECDFFSKPSFVDPRPIVGNRPGFRFVPVVNRILNSVRARTQRLPILSAATAVADAYSYNRLIVRLIKLEHNHRQYDLALWLGDYARGSISGLPTVSFAQGPPGTDARSVLARCEEIRHIAGPKVALKWQLLARLRLSKLGKPPLHRSDHFIVGSRQSLRTLIDLYSIESRRVSILPYPVDLDLFRPQRPKTKAGPLRVLWLGRIVPRKRLDIFLGGAAQAIERGADLKLTIAGRLGFIPGYDRMIQAFPYPARLERYEQIDRHEVPRLFHEHDVLAQPSDEENFGSSVAEAQACGLAVIVGHTNGNADYLCSRDIHLTDQRSQSFSDALVEMWQRKIAGTLSDTKASRSVAEQNFHIEVVTGALIRIMESTSKPHEFKT
jgi:glycosyltransferase involved in cell wall biosynthesis